MSNGGILHSEIHGNKNKTYIPISKFNGRYERTIGLKKSYKEEVEILKEKVPHLFDYIYYVPNQIIHHFCYRNGFVHIDILSLEWEIWIEFEQQKRIEIWINKFNKAEKEKDYEYIFGMMEKQILIEEYIKNFKKIPIKQKYNCFRDLWKRSEYGFNLFTPVFLREVFAYNHYSEERREDLDEFVKLTNGELIITIYRGVTEKSTPYNEAISWTLDLNTAKFFANRFDSNGKIYVAEIHINDVYDFLKDRGEQEVLINPQGLKNLRLHI
jgi:hypothetical protein